MDLASTQLPKKFSSHAPLVTYFKMRHGNRKINSDNISFKTHPQNNKKEEEQSKQIKVISHQDHIDLIE